MMWLTIIVLSAIAGMVCGWFLPGRRALTWGGAVPWLGLLGWLLYNEYVLPYRGGGASMWPIAQLVGGSVAAIVGILAAMGARMLRAREQSAAHQ
jgi:hypothetical protein